MISAVSEQHGKITEAYIALSALIVNMFMCLYLIQYDTSYYMRLFIIRLGKIYGIRNFKLYTLLISFGVFRGAVQIFTLIVIKFSCLFRHSF